MTRLHKQTLTCPRCLNRVDATLWDVIDTREDPYLREEVLQKAVQLVECNICNEAWVEAHPFLYHDPDLKLLLYYCPQFHDLLEAPETDRAELPEAIRDALPDDWIADSAAYRMRLVTTYNDLIEKIHIFERDLDDRLMAVVILALRTRHLEAEGAAPWDAVHFLRATDTTLLFSVYNAETDWQAFQLDRTAYTNAVRTLTPLLPPEGQWAVIDSRWALAFVAQGADPA